MTRSTRRQFLQDVTLGSAATLAVSRSQRLAARQATDALPWKSRIGLELYTVRDRLTTDYEGTLAACVHQHDSEAGVPLLARGVRKERRNALGC